MPLLSRSIETLKIIILLLLFPSLSEARELKVDANGPPTVVHISDHLSTIFVFPNDIATRFMEEGVTKGRTEGVEHHPFDVREEEGIELFNTLTIGPLVKEGTLFVRTIDDKDYMFLLRPKSNLKGEIFYINPDKNAPNKSSAARWENQTPYDRLIVKTLSYLILDKKGKPPFTFRSLEEKKKVEFFLHWNPREKERLFGNLIRELHGRKVSAYVIDLEPYRLEGGALPINNDMFEGPGVMAAAVVGSRVYLMARKGAIGL